MNRRLFLGALTAGGVGAVAGCLGGFADDMTMVSAAPARVSDEAAAEASYEYQGTIKRVETQQVGGEDVELTSYNSVYDRAIELPAERFGDQPVRAGAFSVLAAPLPPPPVARSSILSVGRRQWNSSNACNVATTACRSTGPSGPRARGARRAVPVESVEGTATLNGEYDLDIALDSIRDEHEDDHLVVVAIYPTGAVRDRESERTRIDTLVRGLEQYDDLEVDIVETEGADG